MDRWASLLVALLLSLAFVGSAVTGGATAADGGFDALQSGGVEADGVVLRAAVDADGDATWTIDYRIRLDDRNTTEAFESLQQDIQSNTSDYRGQFADRMRSTVATAENATGREMAITNVSVDASTTFSGQYGVISYSFHWEGFAATEGDRIVLGDSLAGLFLDADTKLVFRWPEGYELRSVDPEPTARGDRSATWDGPADFGANQPRLVIAEAGLLPAWAPLAAVGVFALLALAAGLWYYRQRESEAGEAGSEPSGAATAGRSEAAEPEAEPAAETETTASGAGATSEAAAQSGADATSEAAAQSGADATSEAAAQSGAGGHASAVSDTPEELLSPEERVLALLEERGGRMKQKVVTEELDWSAARTSQVVGGLRDAGKVESFRLGRENVLKFPDDEEESGGIP